MDASSYLLRDSILSLTLHVTLRHGQIHHTIPWRRLVRPKFTMKGIVVQAELSGAKGMAMVDPEKLAQVFRNLLQNAWQYTPPAGTVRISVERRPEGIKLVFANNGEGIAEEDLPFIFERFYRGEKSRSRELGGAGLGLTIVKELVEAHGGQVGAESTPSETKIWFILPV
jgi:two-component system sensor histidine kinase BaeS